MRERGWMRLIGLGALCVAAGEAHAYLDPGSASMILQIVLGGLAGVGVLAKLYWHRIRAFFGTKAGRAEGREEEGEPGPEEERA